MGFLVKAVSTEIVASMASPPRWTATESWCPVAVRPCRPRSPFTRPPRAACSTAAIAAAAAQEEATGEEAKEEEEESMRISGRSWTIKPG